MGVEHQPVSFREGTYLKFYLEVGVKFFEPLEVGTLNNHRAWKLRKFRSLEISRVCEVSKKKGGT